MNNKPLTGFGLENFRVFKKKQYFDLKPITIITGANSSGKSSVIKGLKLLKSNMPAFRWDLTLPYKLLVSEDKFGHLLGSFKQIINYGNSENDSISFSVPVSLKMVNTKFIASLSFRPGLGNEENEFHLKEFAVYLEDDFARENPILRLKVGESILFWLQIDFLKFKRILEADFLKNLSDNFGKLHEYNKNYMDIPSDTKTESISEEEQKLSEALEYFRKTGPKLKYDRKDPDLNLSADKILNDEEFDFFFKWPYKYQVHNALHETVGNVENLERITIYGTNSINYFNKEKYLNQTLDERIFQWLEDYDVEKPILPFYGFFNGELELVFNKFTMLDTDLYLTFSDQLNLEKKEMAKTISATSNEDYNEKLCKYFWKLENEHFQSIQNLWFPYENPHLNQPIQESLRCWDGLVSENRDESEVSFDFWKTPENTRLALEKDPEYGLYYILQRNSLLQTVKPEQKSSNPYTNFNIFNIFIEQCIEKWIVQSKHILESVIFVSHSNENPSRVYTAANGSLFRTLNKYQQIQNRKRKLGDFPNTREFTYKDFVVNKLKNLDIAEDFVIDLLDGGAVLQPFLIINKVKRSVADTGYGYMKLLLFLLNIVTAEDNSTIVIEEPEANLHPDFQSKLADIMVHAHELFGHTFVVETHSEYLIRKLQFLTAKGDLNKYDTVIYYLNHPKLKNRKQVNTVKIKLDGRLDGDFGQGFFDEASNLITDLFRISEDN